MPRDRHQPDTTSTALKGGVFLIRHSWDQPTGDACPDCHAALTFQQGIWWEYLDYYDLDGYKPHRTDHRPPWTP